MVGPGADREVGGAWSIYSRGAVTGLSCVFVPVRR